MRNKHSLPGLVIVLCFMLAGCSGGDGEPGNPTFKTNTSKTDNGQQQPAAADAFISRVMAVIDSTSETAVPVDLNAITVTTPEDATSAPIS